MRNINILVSLFIAVSAFFITACAPTNAFREPKDTEVHAKLFCQDSGSTLGDPQAVYPLEINGRPIFGPSKWSFHQFNLQPGETTIMAKAPISAAVAASGFIKFNAQEGRSYFLKVEPQIENARIYIDNETGETIASILAPKIASQQQGGGTMIFMPAPK